MAIAREFKFDANKVTFIGDPKSTDQIEQEFRAGGHFFSEKWSTEGWLKLGHPDYRNMYVYKDDAENPRYFAETL